jgi:hypothetical protein
MPIMSSWERLTGRSFDFAICHSNGCPNAIGAQAAGVIRAKHILALGTDWTSKDFRPGELKGADVTFFVVRGDPITKIPAPSWAQVSEDTPGLVFRIPFDRPSEIPAGLRNLVTQGRADPDRYPVVPLARPAGFGPVEAHSLQTSYSPAIQTWMQADGDIQKALKQKIQSSERPDRDERKPTGFLPPGGGGPGGGGPGGGSDAAAPGIGSPRSKSTPPGGVSADIVIQADDFQPVRGRKKREASKKP